MRGDEHHPTFVSKQTEQLDGALLDSRHWRMGMCSWMQAGGAARERELLTAAADGGLIWVAGLHFQSAA